MAVQASLDPLEGSLSTARPESPSTTPPDAATTPRTEPDVEVLGTRFAPLTVAGAVDRMMAMIDSGPSGWVSTVNVAILMMMRKDAALRDYVGDSAFVVGDGQPIVWGARLLGRRLPERVTGVDLIEHLCARCEVDGRSVYFLGGSAEVVGELLARMTLWYPELRIGAADGYFSDESADSRAQAVRDFGADVLIVGMGVPRQECFVRDQWERLGCGVAIGVGGSFNVLAGSLQRAPEWMQSHGLEWLYRLKQEPRRLFRRYAVTNTTFCVLFAAAFVKHLTERGRPGQGSQADIQEDLRGV